MLSKFYYEYLSLKRPVIKISCFLTAFLFSFSAFAQTDNTDKKYIIDESSSYYVNLETWEDAPGAGDTIFVSHERTKPIRFQFITGEQNNPVVIINDGGQVNISSETVWGAIVFENCRYIKIVGSGDEHYKYGFKLAAQSCGLAFAELSSDCEAGFIKISHDGFFGIMAKKDYGGNPPAPIPQFKNLLIHDCFVENVTEGMYLGETKSPGMKFRHVRIYNNIVRNTGRESIQIANMVEDVEIFNNTLLDAGQDEENQQNNILQIGDNSVAKVYNNIMLRAPGCGLISFGMGDNSYYNNYMGNCKGIFVDNRLFTDESKPIEITANYFTNNVDRGWIIRNMNEYNNFYIANNLYDADFSFYHNDSGNDENYILENNVNTSIAPLTFTNETENDYSIGIGNPAAYQNLGAPGGPEFFGIDENETPESEQIILVPEMIVDLVEGGSYWSADYLVDEQDMTPENDLHPVSQSWKPFWNMDKGPYHIYVDLGLEYNVTQIAFHDMYNTKNLEVAIGEPGNWEYLFTENCDKYKKWKNHNTNVQTRYIRLSMTESVFAAVNELAIYGYPLQEAEAPQIVLNSSMIVDEVVNGSLWSADYLVDEQDSTPEIGAHPVSQSWKPYWNMNNAPYHIYFDLGQEYDLTKIMFHDMHDTRNIEVSVGEPGNWEYLLTEACDKYITWKNHDINVNTRYIRLSMTESVFAAVNEVLLYGFAAAQEITEKSGGIWPENAAEEQNEDLMLEDLQDLFICQNPVQDNLEINIPNQLNTDFTIEVFDIRGAKLVSENYIQTTTNRLDVNIADKGFKSGVYIMRFSNSQGQNKALKFLKTDY
ncbi:discoidin domain-containing protein [uncultured Draconibacterium sp.]|uniref:discoidin domain-containing protein n=1 Tax=uncultured Draconibacterium sp. TaxID=1573823 RepID=UPI002AA6AAD8|nr:discoidin domain-containing protein [uncultured Draconibacterium sp.]